MRSVILGAGEGQRLRPYTADRPKCLVELCGRSLLERGLEVHRRLGIDEVYVVTGYERRMIEALGLPTFHNPDYARTNMVASLMAAAQVLDGADDVLVVYSDVVYEEGLLAALAESPHEVSLAVNGAWRELWAQRMEDPLADAETLELDGQGRVLRLGQRPRSYDQVQGQYTGLMKFAAGAAARIPATYAALDPGGPYDGRDRANMYMTSFLQHWIDEVGEVHSVPVDGGWLEVDTVEDLELYERLAREDRLDSFCRLAP